MMCEDDASVSTTPEGTLECPICSCGMPQKSAPWTFYCRRCDYWGSTLAPVTDVKHDAFLDGASGKENPIAYLDDVRSRNFAVIMDAVSSRSRTRGGSLLEVGCGPGMFLAHAQAAGFRVTGIEPYEVMARRGINQGLDIRIGLFPSCMAEDERFDVVVFNDVLEHLPMIDSVLTTCFAHLNRDGLLVVNIPSSKGLFFRMAYAATLCGIWTPWERMWQKGFFTPHLHYVSTRSLDLMCNRAGFLRVGRPVRLCATTHSGLWDRIRASSGMPLPLAALLFCGASCLTAVCRLFPPDCVLYLYRKRTGLPHS